MLCLSKTLKNWPFYKKRLWQQFCSRRPTALRSGVGSRIAPREWLKGFNKFEFCTEMYLCIIFQQPGYLPICNDLGLMEQSSWKKGWNISLLPSPVSLVKGGTVPTDAVTSEDGHYIIADVKTVFGFTRWYAVNLAGPVHTFQKNGTSGPTLQVELILLALWFYTPQLCYKCCYSWMFFSQRNFHFREKRSHFHFCFISYPKNCIKAILLVFIFAVSVEKGVFFLILE